MMLSSLRRLPGGWGVFLGLLALVATLNFSSYYNWGLGGNSCANCRRGALDLHMCSNHDPLVNRAIQRSDKLKKSQISSDGVGSSKENLNIHNIESHAAAAKKSRVNKPKSLPSQLSKSTKLEVNEKKIIHTDDELMKKIKASNQELLSEDKNYHSSSNTCSKVLTQVKYEQLISTNLKAWHSLVPPHTSMDSNNCWYDKNINTLPTSLREKMASITKISGMPKKFNKSEVDWIMRNFVGTNSARKSYPSSNGTSYYFCLPRAYVIGFPKCGTTLMHRNFIAHSGYASPHWKEPHFWRELLRTADVSYKKLEILLYLFHFHDPAQKLRQHKKQFITDASVSTVFVSSMPFKQDEDACVVPLLLFKIFPHAKFVVLVRNPIYQMWSDFWFFCPPWQGKSRFRTSAIAAEKFHELSITAIKEFMKCRQEHSLLYCATKVSSNEGEHVACKKVRLGLSIYYVHMQRWMSVYPRDQLMIIRFEDYVADIPKTMEKVWEFIDVPKGNKTVENVVNPNAWVQKFGRSFKILPKTVTLLQEFYKPYNVMLAQFLGDDRYLEWNNES